MKNHAESHLPGTVRGTPEAATHKRFVVDLAQKTGSARLGGYWEVGSRKPANPSAS